MKMAYMDDFERWFRDNVDVTGNECFAVAVIDKDHNFLGADIIGRGDRSTVVVDPAKIFRYALRFKKAKAVCCAHNHPGGTWEFSSKDWSLAYDLSKTGKLLRIPVACHMVITEDGYNEHSKRFEPR